jgi:NAD(P)-dependent dehydrogenase (short-subunit alcohol dehydrogenase family)
MSTTTARPPTLAGRTAIVTGASSGIGRATAAVLVERGARIAGLARDHVRLDSLARELGRACVPVALDLSDVGAIDALPERLPDGFATPDLLVNCAGHDLGGRRPFHEAAAEDWSDALAVNLIGLMRLTQVVLKGMLRRGSGDIVNLGSITSRRIWPGQAVRREQARRARVQRSIARRFGCLRHSGHRDRAWRRPHGVRGAAAARGPAGGGEVLRELSRHARARGRRTRDRVGGRTAARGDRCRDRASADPRAGLTAPQRGQAPGHQGLRTGWREGPSPGRRACGRRR